MLPPTDRLLAASDVPLAGVVAAVVIDVHVRPSSVRQRFANNSVGIADFLAWARPLAAERILFESMPP